MPLSEYVKRETWLLKEAVLLLGERQPTRLDQFDLLTGHDGPLRHIYANLKDAIDSDALPCIESLTNDLADRRVRPWDVVAWATARGDKVPDWMNAISAPKCELKAKRDPSAKTPMPPSRAHVSDKLAILNQAADKFWANADRDDRSTHQPNAKVVQWLIQKGYTETLAKKAATIIRPDWAPTGRKPEE
jgi:hypothetical protein